MAEFIRDHAFLTLIIILVLIVAGNVFLFLQSKNPDKNLKDWFMMKNTTESLGDPWKEETEQLTELSERVAALKNTPSSDKDK
jgi:hypothetical protein